MAVSMYTVIVALSAMILGPVIEVCNTARNFGLIFAAADRIYRVLEAKPLVQDSGNDINTKDLTPEEKKEQHKLRKEFIASVRMNLRSQLDNINIQEKDGSITNLGEKYGSKESH